MGVTLWKKAENKNACKCKTQACMYTHVPKGWNYLHKGAITDGWFDTIEQIQVFFCYKSKAVSSQAPACCVYIVGLAPVDI